MRLDANQADSTVELSQNAQRAELMRRVFRLLEEAEHPLCVLHGYHGFPEQIESDIDVVSERPTDIFRILSSSPDLRVVQVIEHSQGAYYYVIQDRASACFVALDASVNYRRHQRIFLDSGEFLNASQDYKFFKVPPAALEFAYYMVKKVSKRSLNDTQANRLSNTYHQDPAGCQAQLARFFPPSEVRLIQAAAESRDWSGVQAQIRGLHRKMLATVPSVGLEFWKRELARWVWRIKEPTGFMVAFLGPDGAGKSTVMAQVQDDLRPVFWHRKRYAGRPYFGRNRPEIPVTDPHGKPPRGLIASLAKLGLWWVDVTVSYLKDLFPRLVQSTFILFDRYYYDLQVDPRRYRYGGPMSLVNFVSRFIPCPDLVILLDAPPEILQARKQEVTYEEATRARGAYLDLIKGLPNGHVVDASRPLPEVVFDVERLILDALEKRTLRRYGDR